MTEINRKQYQKIKGLKSLDFQICNFCQKVNILNLGNKPFGKFYCREHEKEYLLCWELCYKVCLNILGCQLYSEKKPVIKVAVKVNRAYYVANCYLCNKNLKGAGKHGIVKNRNNPSFWGLKSEWKILCLKCLQKRFYGRMEGSKRKTLNKYLRRGYE